MKTNEQFLKALQSVFVKKTKQNPLFSIRSFAHQLQIEPSSLAQILSGKRKLTDKMCKRIGTKLGFSPLKMRVLMKEVEPRNDSFEDFNKLGEDAFKVISDWHYYSILELTYCDEFRGSIQWISRVLGLSFAETLDAVERLKRLNYLEITADGKWVDRLGDSNNLGNEFKAPAFTEHQRQVLHKALKALDETSYEKRVQSSMTVAVSQEKVAEAKSRILNFIEELDAFLKSGQTKDEVYTISFSLFPMSKILEGKAI
jgi:plasmid maintenance system antidote protein VapI/DNA-binding Lrp family transcriptional regulator